MARASLTTQARNEFRLAPTLTAAVADGDIVDVGSRVWVHNGSGAPITVTAQVVAETSGLELEDLVETVAAGADVLIGPFSRTLFGQASDAAIGASRVLIDYSAVTSVTRAAVST